MWPPINICAGSGVRDRHAVCGRARERGMHGTGGWERGREREMDVRRGRETHAVCEREREKDMRPGRESVSTR